MTEPTNSNVPRTDPTEKTLYTEPHSDHWGTFEDRLFQTGSGPRKGIGIQVGGTARVLPLKSWDELAGQLEKRDALIKTLVETLEFLDVETSAEVQEENVTPLFIRDIHRIVKDTLSQAKSFLKTEGIIEGEKI